MTDDDGSPASSDVSTWLSDIEKAQRAMGAWHKRCDKIRKRYRADSHRSSRQSQYQMLWANVETLKPAIFARLPSAVCARRYRDSDPVGRTAGEILERAVNFTMETGDYESRFKQVRDNLVMYSRGTARLRYEPITVEVESDDPLDVADVEGPDVAKEDELESTTSMVEVLDFEHVRIDFVARDDFIHPQARVWEEVPWLAYRVFMTRDELVKRFGNDIGKAITIDAGPELSEEDRRNDATSKATVYEIWDKTKRQVSWVAKGYPKVLDSSEPYLHFEGFYPSPKPAYGTLTTDSLEPIPDYVYYQDQAEEINKLTSRIDALSDSLKLVGFYPGGPNGEGAPEIERAVRPGFENKLIAVKSWAAFTEGGKGSAPIVWLPIEMVADIIEKCIALRKELISDVWELTGVSDIMRGQGESDETATGVNAKSKFGATRLSQKQGEMARFSRDIVRMVAEIISDVFQPDTLMKMTNMPLPSDQDVMLASRQGMVAPQLPAPSSIPAPAAPGAVPLQGAVPQPSPAPVPPPAPVPAPSKPPVTSDAVIAMLRDGVMRRFRIDIETDSTIASDEAQDRDDRTEFIKATTDFVTGWAPILQGNPELAPLACGLLKFGARGFRIGRELEETIDETADKLMAMASQPKPPPQPSPEDQIQLAVAKIKAQSDLQKAQIDQITSAQNNQQQLQSNKFDIEKAIIDHSRDVASHRMDMQKILTPSPVQQTQPSTPPMLPPSAAPDLRQTFLPPGGPHHH